MYEAELLRPFLGCTETIFRSMLGSDLELVNSGELKGRLSLLRISGVVSMNGLAEGNVVVSCSESMALGVTEAMLGSRPTSLDDDDVFDAVKELANMVGGSAKSKLPQFRLRLSLPSALCGPRQVISFDPQIRPYHLSYVNEWGQLGVTVGMRMLPEHLEEIASAFETAAV